MVDFNNIKRVAASLVGAVVLSATCVVGAVGPARASLPVKSPAAAWQAEVGQQLSDTLRMPGVDFGNHDYAAATVTAKFDAAGTFTGAELAKSSGIAAVDREAVRAVSKISFPKLPASMTGRTSVPVMVYLGEGGDSDHEARIARLAAKIAA